MPFKAAWAEWRSERVIIRQFRCAYRVSLIAAFPPVRTDIFGIGGEIPRSAMAQLE
jgi:hypothetical protein